MFYAVSATKAISRQKEPEKLLIRKMHKHTLNITNNNLILVFWAIHITAHTNMLQKFLGAWFPDVNNVDCNSKLVRRSLLYEL